MTASIAFERSAATAFKDFREFVFIDRGVDHLERLLLGLRPEVKAVILNAREPAPVQMARALSGRCDVIAVHVVAHGQAGAVSFSAGELYEANLAEHGDAWAEIGRALCSQGKLVLWSCETARGEAGQALVDALRARCSAAVLAATVLIGAQEKGGTWTLDYFPDGQTAEPPLTVAGQARYPGVLISRTGTAGNDVLNGDDGADTLDGLAGDDVLSGAGGADILRGGDGSDTLKGGPGADQLDGGAGIDTADYGTSSSAVYVNLSGTWANLGGDAEGDVLIGIENLVGSAWNDVLQGDAGANQLSGGGGDDYLIGGPGADRLDGGTGIDEASYLQSAQGVTVNLATGIGMGGDAAGDRFVSIENVNGSQQADTLVGDANDNHLWGDDGDDVLVASGGNDLLDGGSGIDTADFSTLTQGITAVLDGDTGNGAAVTGVNRTNLTGIENLIGSNFADTLFGDAANNTLSGGAGGDVLIGGAGADTLNGGDGVDQIQYFGSTAGVTVNLATNINTGGDAEGDHVRGVEDVLGSRFDDTLTGDGGVNVLRGDDGNDVLNGAGGNDVLEGGSGHNALNGGDGNDLIMGGNGTDNIDGGAGNDTLILFSSGTLGVFASLTGGTSYSKSGGMDLDTITVIENLVVHPRSGRPLPGSSGSDNARDELIGDGNVNLLDGGYGADSLDGRGGVDTADYSHSEATVNVSLVSGAANHGGDAEGDVLTNIENLNGSSFGDVLTGDANANVLNGQGGADTMAGGAGNDTYVVDNGGDVATEGVGAGTDSVQASISYSLGNDLENLTLTGTGALNGTGNALANVMAGNDANNSLDGGAGTDTASYAGATAAVTVSLATQGAAQNTVGAGSDTLSNFENLAGSTFNDRLSGNAGNNVLNGGGGADTLTGGVGNDTYVVDNAGDLVVETAGGGVDTVQSTVTYALGTEVENLLLTGANAINGTGNDLANGLTGNAAANVLNGGIGNDVLAGKAGSDSLTGGAGNDAFVFDTALNNLAPAANIDHILDFSAGQDRLRLDDAVFTKFAGATAVSADQFAASAANPIAATVNQVLLYDTGTGALYYDADGSGSGTSLLVAILDNHASITAGDFSIV